MDFFTRLGRALLLAAAVAVGSAWLAGCGKGGGDGKAGQAAAGDSAAVGGAGSADSSAKVSAAMGTFTDSRDGKTYKTVKIGGQTWTAPNLNYAAEGSKCYEDKPENCEKYGRLYNWETAKKVCPQGWKLPSKEDWETLIKAVGGTVDPDEKGKTVKALISTSGWGSYEEDGVKISGNGTDDFGFSAMPGGSWSEEWGDSEEGGGGFWDGGKHGEWWTNSAERDQEGIKTFYITMFGSNSSASVDQDGVHGIRMFIVDYWRSVRCVK